MAQRIAQALPTLTRSHRRMADYVLAHPLQTATMPIDELAATLGVSVATANRFARALAFEGYPQFRAALVRGFESTLAPVEKLRHSLEHPSSVAEVFANALAESRRNIELTRQSMDPQSVELAVQAILQARRVYVMGYGASSWLAGLLYRNLDLHCDQVQLLSSVESSSYGARVLTRLQPTDLLIAIAFPRYFADTIYLARRAHEMNVPVLGLTDCVSSPLAPLATVALYAHSGSQYFANSEASVLALIEALSSAVAHQAKGALKAATQLAESVLPWLHGSPNERLRASADAGTRRAATPAWPAPGASSLPKKPT